MAGGDGSQARSRLSPRSAACRWWSSQPGPAHLALDLGLDRDDVVGALDAYGDAVERRLDLADMNGHVFVNNVSLGLYATIVRSPEYRDAKVGTTLATLPQVLGPDSQPFDLRFTGPDGAEHDGAHVIQISNNPYGKTAAGMGSRPTPGHAPAGHHLPRQDRCRDGEPAHAWTRACWASSPLCSALTEAPRRSSRRSRPGTRSGFGGFHAWSAPTFDVTSGGPIEIGLDGETQVMDPPLRFSIRPDQVRVRLPRHAPGYSPAARALGWREGLWELWGIVLGHPSRFQAEPSAAIAQGAASSGRCARPLAVHLMTAPAELPTHTRRAVGAARSLVELADLDDQLAVRLRAR